MKGLVIWAHSYCRSTLGFYRGLGLAFGVPIKLIMFIKTCNNRKSIGFTDDEFGDLDISYFKDIESSKLIIDQYKDWNHLFGVYQQDNGCRDVLHYAKMQGCKVAVISEAPCNMDKMPRRIFKHLYMKFVLPFKVRQATLDADFLINLSGGENWRMEEVGWKASKIIPCGYYSPAIVGSHLVKRTEKNWKEFTILLSGVHQWHRSPMVLLKALHELDKRGVKYECNITQKGPLLGEMETFISQNNMTHVHLLGFLPMEELISNYENCSVYVGAGNNEPWGMRLNDALLCGAPLIVNRGMGGFKLVEDYGCGLTFAHNDHKALADALERLIKDKQLYLQFANAAYEAAGKVTPTAKAKEIVDVIRDKFPKWV